MAVITGYNSFGIQSMNVEITQDKKNKLVICTGIIEFDYKGVEGDWDRSTLTFDVNIPDQSGWKVKNAVVSASLNSISNVSTSQKAVNLGWALDEIKVNKDGNNNVIVDDNGNIHITAAIAARGADAFLDRIGYQVTAWLSQIES